MADAGYGKNVAYGTGSVSGNDEAGAVVTAWSSTPATFERLIKFAEATDTIPRIGFPITFGRRTLSDSVKPTDVPTGTGIHRESQTKKKISNVGVE
ncbi:MAG TPA: hypothetical protein VF624_00105 [Tepidisphaeraceae bacterium]|jgi:hypothetical protein